MKNRKKIIYTGLFLLALSTSPIYGQDTMYHTTNGTINFNEGNATIELQANENQSLIGKSFRLYRIFDVENGNESIHYTLNTKYKSEIQSFFKTKTGKEMDEDAIVDYLMTIENNSNQSAYRKLMEELQVVVSKFDADTVYIDNVLSNGNVKITNLKYGYYIVDEITNVQDKHSASSLLMVTTANPNATIRFKSDYPSIIKKIKEDDHDVGWNDIGDYEIGQTIPYKYETAVPDMSGYSSYYFCFEDEMDSALTLDENSIEIQVGSTKLNSTQYTYNKTNSGFKLVIENLKQIQNVDTGQKILVTYNAHLNENAKVNMSKKGFQNKIRLEYSNDPRSDSKGKTPWDSVTCFTYTLDGLKVNEKETKLEGATFKLYRDEACQNEVYVQKSGTDYVVSQTASSESIVSNNLGSFKIYGLDQGKYYLKEIKAPKGYRLLKDVIELEITPTYIDDRNNLVTNQDALLSLKATSFETVLDTSLDDASVQLKVINQTHAKLPATGSVLSVVLVVAGSTLMIYVASKKKQNQ